MEFAHPVWLLALAVPLAWSVAVWRRRSSGSVYRFLRHPSLLPADGVMPSRPRLPMLLQTLAFVLLVIALAQPRSLGGWITRPPEGREIVLVLDTSGTMSVGDFEFAGHPISRLTVLKQVLGKFIAGRAYDRIGLVVFGSQIATLSPPTFDHKALVAQLDRLQVGVAGDSTALGEALGLALRSLRHGRLRPIIILVSDGGDSNAGQMTPAEAVAVARSMHAAIHTVQIGGDQFGNGGKPEANPQPGLADIARLTGGRFWRVRSTADANSVIHAIDRMEKTIPRPAKQRVVHEWYLALLLPAALCLALAGILGARGYRE